jgi:hypothetical protein
MGMVQALVEPGQVTANAMRSDFRYTWDRS